MSDETTDNPVDLTRWRMRVTLLAQRVTMAVLDAHRDPPWREHQPNVERQLEDMGLHLHRADADELRAAEWFLTRWLQLLDVFDTGGLPWPDPDDTEDR